MELQVTHCLRSLTNASSVHQIGTRTDGARKVALWSELVLFGGTDVDLRIQTLGHTIPMIKGIICTGTNFIETTLLLKL